MGELGLGIDAGGTQTRWALADAAGAIVAEGAVAGLSATQMGNAAGRDAVRGIFSMLATQVLAARHAAGRVRRPDRVRRPGHAAGAMAGRAACGCRSRPSLCATTWKSPTSTASRPAKAIWSMPAPVRSPPGSTRTALSTAPADAASRWTTAAAASGSRAKRMRHIWRLEDEQPGAWQQSAMARAVFEHVGGSDWSLSRQFIYGQDRGAIGRLALAVAASADADPVARAILELAGRELARIALALVGRHGPRPIVLSGRAATLHPLIAQAMRAALPPELSLRQKEAQAHHAAARIALHSRN